MTSHGGERGIDRRCVLAGGVATLGLAGCTVLQPQAPTLYTLNPPKGGLTGMAPAGWALSVETPAAPGALDSQRIVAIRHSTAVEPFADVAWSDRAPAMLGNLIVESFENSHALASVAHDAQGLRADYLLKSELRDFQAEYDNNDAGLPPRVRVRLVAKLVAMPRRVVEASQSFEAAEPVTGDAFPAVVAAFDRAVGSLLSALVEWTLATGTVLHERPNESTPSTRAKR